MFALSMFGIPNVRAIEATQRYREKLLASAVPWSPDIKWAPELALQADSFNAWIAERELFDLSATPERDPNRLTTDFVRAPGGEWVYYVKLLPRNSWLWLPSGKRDGIVGFDGDVRIPALHHRGIAGGWEKDPTMSMTPMEVMTLRAGTRLAKGNVVVAGLGLGHQLVEVSKRRSVKRLTLIEKDRDLVDFILPRIAPRLGHKLDDVIVGDVFEKLSGITADVAVVDTFAGYGGNAASKRELEAKCKNVGKIWVWGS